jgi:hypothetical protein
MTAQRWFALLLIGLEAVAFAVMFESALLPAIACALALAGVWGKVQIHLSKDRMQLAALALAAVFGFKFVLFPAESLTRTTIFMDFNFGHTVGLFFLYLQACLFFIRWKGNALPSANILFSAMVLILCGRVVSDESMNRSYLMFVWGYIALTALFIASRPRGEAHATRSIRPLAIVLLTGIVLLSFAGSLGMSLGLEAVEDDLMSLVGRAMANARASIGPGFSSTAHLGSLARIQSSERDRISLRIYCDGTPGYLRGRAYVNYDKNSWTCDTEEGSTLFPSKSDGALAGLKRIGAAFFQLQEPGESEPKRLEVWSELKRKKPFSPRLELLLSPPKSPGLNGIQPEFPDGTRNRSPRTIVCLNKGSRRIPRFAPGAGPLYSSAREPRSRNQSPGGEAVPGVSRYCLEDRGGGRLLHAEL